MPGYCDALAGEHEHDRTVRGRDTAGTRSGSTQRARSQPVAVVARHDEGTPVPEGASADVQRERDIGQIEVPDAIAGGPPSRVVALSSAASRPADSMSS